MSGKQLPILPIEVACERAWHKILSRRADQRYLADSGSSVGGDMQVEKTDILNLVLRRNIDPMLLRLLSRVMENHPTAKHSLLALLRGQQLDLNVVKLLLVTLSLSAKKGLTGAGSVLANLVHAPGKLEYALLNRAIRQSAPDLLEVLRETPEPKPPMKTPSMSV